MGLRVLCFLVCASCLLTSEKQRYMIATLKDAGCVKIVQYLEACHLIFEKGILHHRQVNNPNSTVIENIKEGMKFFEEWCHKHEEKVYVDNRKRARQKNFLAWQTWDLLRLMVHGFLGFCDWFFEQVDPDDHYFVSPLRVNGSALESVFSTLKHAAGGNLSTVAYGPAIGKLIHRKNEKANKNSEKGYRDVVLNIDGEE